MYTGLGYQMVRDELLIQSPGQVDDHCKIEDRALIAISIFGEFHTLPGGSSVYGEALEAMSLHYHSPAWKCQGFCDTIEEQILLIGNWEAWGYAGQFNNLEYVMGSGFTQWQNYLVDADKVLNPSYQWGAARASWQWGNVYEGSPGAKYIKGELLPEEQWWTGNQPFVERSEKLEDHYWFVVMTGQQNAECGAVGCAGWSP